MNAVRSKSRLKVWEKPSTTSYEGDFSGDLRKLVVNLELKVRGFYSNLHSSICASSPPAGQSCWDGLTERSVSLLGSCLLTNWVDNSNIEYSFTHLDATLSWWQRFSSYIENKLLHGVALEVPADLDISLLRAGQRSLTIVSGPSGSQTMQDKLDRV